MSDIYIKQLEDENEKLRQKLEEYSLKSGCYDIIIDHLALINHPSNNVTNCSRIDEKYIELVVPIRRFKNNIFIRKIADDFLEEQKADLGRRRR